MACDCQWLVPYVNDLLAFLFGQNGTTRILVSYLTLLSDLDLVPDTDQFVASPSVRYINPELMYLNWWRSH